MLSMEVILSVSSFDMNITYNNGFSWYYGTDANPPAGQYDLVTVAAHEIGHGLNFSGSAGYSGGNWQLWIFRISSYLRQVYRR